MIETTTDDYECTRLGRSEVCGKVKPAVRPCAAVNLRALVFKESWLRAFARATQWQEVRTSTVDRRRSKRARDAYTLTRDKWSGRGQPFHFECVFFI